MTTALLTATLIIPAVTLADVKIMIDDQILTGPRSNAIIYKSRVLVPVRSVFERLGATVTWDPATATVSLERGTMFAKVFTGSQSLEVNGETRLMDVEPQNWNGVMRIPLRAVGEMLGAKIHWDSPNRTVHIWSPPITDPPAR